MLKKKALICLAAGNSQLILIKKTIELGYKVIAVDKNPNSVGFKYSSKSIICSTYDSKTIINELLKFCEEYEYLGIINRSSGLPVLTAAKIAKYFNLKLYPHNSAEIILNKHLFFEFLDKQNILIPKTQSISSDFSNKNFFEYPFIVKPSLSSVGKSGVFKISSNEELKKKLSLSFRSSTNNIVIAQEYIEGNDIVLISFVKDKKLIPICFIEEINFFSKSQQVIGAGVMCPARISKKIQEKIINVSNTIINNLKIENSAFMISFRNKKNDVFPIEIHLDFGGDLVLDVLLPKCINFDVIKFGIQIMAKNNFVSKRDSYIKPTAVLYAPGNGLNSEKDHEIVTNDTLNELTKKINNKLKLMYD